MIPERIIFVSRGITVDVSLPRDGCSWLPNNYSWVCDIWAAVRQDLQTGDVANLRALSDSSRCKFLTTVMPKILVLRDVTVCRWINGFRRFGVLSCLCVYLAAVLVAGLFQKLIHIVSILSFRRVLYVECFLLGISPASEV